MAPSEQITVPVLQGLLEDAALAGEWLLDPSRSTISLKNRSMWGLAPVNGAFRQVTGWGTVSPAGSDPVVLRVIAHEDVLSAGRMMQRKPRWLVEVSMG